MKKIARIIKYFGAVVTCFCLAGMLFIFFNGSRNRNDYWGVYFSVMLFEVFLGLVLWDLADELCFDRHYSYTPPIFLLKFPNKTSTKRLEINLELPMKEEEEVEERIISPLEEAWRWTQDKKSKFHKVVLCQDLVQVKMRNFSHFNPPEAQPQCVFFHTIVRIHLVTYSCNGYEFVSYCRKLPDIQKSTGMPAYNRGF